MATIRTAIMLEDRMSRQFQALNRAMMSSIDYMRDIDRVSGNMMNTSAIEAAHRELQQVEAAFEEVREEIMRADDAQDRFNQGLRGAGGAARNLLGTLGAIAGTYISLQGIGEAIRISDELTNIDARLNLVVESMPKVDPLSTKLNIDTNGLTEVQQLQQQIFDAAQRSLSPYTQTADLVGKIGMNAKDAFTNTNELVLFAELLNKQFGIAGTNAEGVTSATLQLTQALGSGVLRGEELNSVFEAAPNIIHTIADYLDQPIGKIREMAADGVLTADVVKNAMFASADSINDKFNSMPFTFEQIWTEFQNNALWAFKGVLKQINDIFNSDRFAAFRESAGQSMQTVADMASQVLSIIASVGAFVYDNWSLIAPVIGTATFALGMYATALLAVKVAKMATTYWTGLQILAMGLLTATTWASVTATTTATAAVWGLNAALAANPVFIVITAIVVLIGVLYLAVAAVNHFAGTSISATGIVAGVFLAFGATVANVFIYIWNVAVEAYSNIYNVAVTIAEGMVNVFSGDLSAIGRMFVQLGDNVLGILESIAKGIDFVFGSNLASAVGGWRSSLEGWSTEVLGENKYQIDRMVASDFQMKTFDIPNAYKTGYNWGDNLFKSDKAKGMEKDTSADDLQRIIDNAMKNAMGAEGLGDKLDKANRNGGSTAGNTAKMAKSLEGADDELKYLRELAERDSVNRYTTAEIKVDMKNENYINSEMDIDGVINLFGEKIEEAAEVIAEGGEVEAF